MSLLILPAGRRAKYLVALLALLFAAGLASRAGDAQTTDDPAAQLPSGAQSLQALRALEAFPSGDVSPAVTVFFREGGLTPADRERVRTAAQALRTEPRLSETGEGALLVTPLRGDDEAVAEQVQALRERVGAGASGGLQVAVTGGAAFTADLSEQFEGLDGTLLIGTATLVLVLLVLIYRSPVFWLIPFAVVLLTEAASRGAQALAADAGLDISPAASGIAVVLTFGAATDYALLLVARYREELRVLEDAHEAMRRALVAAGPSILASGLTVVCALVCLLLADVRGTAALGPVSAGGVALAMAFSLTLLPAALLIAGRRAFWPFVPRPGQGPADPRRSVWGRLGARVQRRPRPVWLAGTGMLVVLSLGLAGTDLGLGQESQFAGETEATRGQALLARGGFPAGSAATVDVVVRDPARADAVARELRERRDLVAAVGEPERGAPGVRLPVTLRTNPFAPEALDAVPALRAATGPGVLVGGRLAQDYDTREAAERDNLVVVPVVLALVVLILVAVLRSVLMPALLLASVVLSFGAALGTGIVVSDVVFGLETQDPTLPLLAFIFLVALGVDYNIFLVARAREESLALGTPEGTLRALAATGGVITSAGIVLAGTFSILALLPIVVLIQLGFIIAFGVLLDTLLVRSVIVPALAFDLGDRVWWPARLGAPRAARVPRPPAGRLHAG